MSYQVIARKFRPQSFDQLVGQNHVSQTLSNALKNSRLHHALLFTGPRGTGKTSSARILAKSLRCANSKDFIPCNQCQSCEEIATGRSVDVIEIDGASNNSVDAIRDLCKGVGYLPSSGRYKVYIIDEVHMLSASAFNALLKTLEEPPAYVVFIMATTEAHKIPQTILSRCQRFDFRSIPTKQIATRLAAICTSENVTADEEALWIIARQGDGSMRDSQSLLDQVVTFANGPLSRELVIEILGLTDRALLLETLAALINRDTGQMVACLEKIHRAGYDPSLFAKDLLENIRNLLLIKIGLASQANSPIIELPDSEIRFLTDLGSQTAEEDIHLLFDMALKGASDLPRAGEPLIVLEMVLLRMVNAPRVLALTQFLSGNAVLPTRPATTQGVSSPSERKQTQTTSSSKSVPVSSPSPQPVRKVDALGLNPAEKWMGFVQALLKIDALFAAKVENLVFVGLNEKCIELAVPSKMAFLKDQISDATVRNRLQGFIDQHWGAGYTLNIKMGKESLGGVTAQDMVQKKEKEKEDETAKQIAEHPLIKSATAALKGQIKSIKNSQP